MAHILLIGIGTLFAVQLLVVLWLTLVHALRRRRIPAEGFPSLALPPVRVQDTEVTLYTEGAALFEAMLTAIQQAQKTIFLETYIWKDDVLGRQFKEALIQRAQAGVKVYVIFDWFANLVVPRKFKRFPHVPGLQVYIFSSLTRPWHLLRWRNYGLDHRKLLVVDEAIGFVGGYNIGESYRIQWRDTHLRFVGPANRDLGYAFADLWNQDRNPHPPIAMPARPWSSTLRIHRNDPLRASFPIRNIYLEAIEHAQSHIAITNAYFVPDPAIRQGLIRAAQRGVRVEILIPWQSNHVFVDWLARHYFAQYLAAGIKLYGYEGAMIHAKSATIDGVWSTVGTANLDRLSLAGNFEINVEIFDPQVAQQMARIFAVDLFNARPIDPEAWARRPWLNRAAELILSPLWQWG